jgi:hypothetical protein
MKIWVVHGKRKEGSKQASKKERKKENMFTLD